MYGKHGLHAVHQYRIFQFVMIYNFSTFICLLTDEDWETKWVYSEHPGKEFGKFVRTAGKFFNDEEADLGE